MQPDPDLRSKARLLAVRRESALDGDGAGDRGFWIVEANEETVARGDHLLAMVGGEQRTQGLIVPTQEILPSIVSQRFGEVRGPHDVGEHECLHHPLAAPSAAPQLPRQQLLDVFDLDRLSGTRQRGLAQEVLLDAGRVCEVDLEYVALEPLECGGRDGDAVSRPNAAMTIYTHAKHSGDASPLCPRSDKRSSPITRLLLERRRQ